MYEYFRQRTDLSRKELNPFSLNFVRQGTELYELERKREESVATASRLHGCKQFCDTELPKYERQYRDGFMYIKGRRQSEGNETRKSKSDEQDDYEDTFPLARFRKRAEQS